MKLYLIAGEASGDLHGSNLVKALIRKNPNVEIRAWGGDLMEQAGATLVRHYRDLAFMGFWEVLKNLRTILRNLASCKADIEQFQPDALVLIDYPGFNLRIAKWAKKQGIPVVYYISPQIWAWHQSRVKQIQQDVDQMLVILPFEQDFYKKHGVNVSFVGHPLLDAIGPPPPDSERDPKLIALLPGSRKQELKRILPPMLEVTRDFPDYRFVIARAGSLDQEVYEEALKEYPEVRFETNQTYELLRTARVALVKSGTSTLEAALFNVPQVVCYAGNAISYAIAKRVIQVKYISLVNLIMDAPLVCELIQHELRRENLKRELQTILSPEGSLRQKEGYALLRQILGNAGASDQAAEIILEQAVKKPEA
ncbi:MAG: lipid-A-disaccharide synthase [Saprospiraceae bacterium]